MLSDLFLIYSLYFTRAIVLIAFLPLEFANMGPGLRLMLAALLALLGINCQILPYRDFSIIDYAQEAMLGFIIALPILLIVQAADFLGDLLESLRGQNLGGIADPMFNSESAYLSLFIKGLAWIGLLSFGIMEKLIVEYLNSYKVSFLEISLWQKSLYLFCFVLNSALKIALPFALIFLAIEMVFLFISKIIPSVCFSGENFTVKQIFAFCGLVYLIQEFLENFLIATVSRSFLNLL